MLARAFEPLVGQIPARAGVSDAEHNELLILARSADREAERAKAGDPGHQLGSTMSRFLVRFTEVVSAGDPALVETMVGEIREIVDSADREAVERLRVALDKSRSES